MENSDWVGTGNDELDATKMKEKYTPRAIALGWSTNTEGDAACPNCLEKNT
jgi:hypothetical protein